MFRLSGMAGISSTESEEDPLLPARTHYGSTGLSGPDDLCHSPLEGAALHHNEGDRKEHVTFKLRR